jgi:hypothetical protein
MRQLEKVKNCLPPSQAVALRARATEPTSQQLWFKQRYSRIGNSTPIEECLIVPLVA